MYIFVLGSYLGAKAFTTFITVLTFDSGGCIIIGIAIKLQN